MPETWIDLTGSEPDRNDLWSAVLNSPIDVVLVTLDQLPPMPVPGHVRIASLIRDENELERAAKEESVTLVVVDASNTQMPRRDGKPVVVRATIRDQADVDRCVEMLRTVDGLIVELRDETNIPLELLIAEAQSIEVPIVKRVATVEQALITLGVLESGTSGVLFPLEGVQEVARLNEYLSSASRTQLELTEATVTRVEHAGMGYRGCVDTASLFAQDEGMLVGSTSAGGILVCAEVHYLPYMNLRPFRVNAGAVHSYVWTPEGRTAYITDLEVGTQVLAVNTAGVARPVLVGRVKTEVRPLRLIVADAGGTRVNVLLQDDWHVRIFDANGEVRNCSTIEPGDKLLSHICEPGRHVGIKVEETISEW